MALRFSTRLQNSLWTVSITLCIGALFLLLQVSRMHKVCESCPAANGGFPNPIKVVYRTVDGENVPCPPNENSLSRAERALPAGAEPLNLDFEWTFFITPQDFIDEADFRQRRAIQSWLRLTPKPNVVLLGKGEGYDRVARDMGLSIGPLDMNFVGMPLSGSLVYEASIWPTSISCILNSDIVLTQSFANAVAKINSNPKLSKAWFFSGARYDITTLPDEFDFFGNFDDAKFTDYVKTNGVLHTAGGLDYFVWNKGPRIFNGPMPPFIRGKSKFDNWIVHEAVAAGLREVIDGSQFAVAAHIAHSYVRPNNEGSVFTPMKGTFWQKDKKSNWMIYHNSHLALNYGTYTHQAGTTIHIPWKLGHCEEPSLHYMCLTKRVRLNVCPCDHSHYALKTQTDPEIYRGANIRLQTKKVLACGAIVVENKTDYAISAYATANQSYGLPFTLEDLLPIVARNNTVLLTGGSFGYRDMLMNFVCNLRRLGIYDHLIIAAFDEQMYEFGFRMGLPIFFNQQAPTAGLADFEYGSQSFRRLTKLKSQMVLRILKMGYDVIWTDSDIVWYQNPIPLLHAMESDLVVQSNAPYPQEPADNGPLRINSGFYRARSTPLTIDAFANIVASAQASRLSEQPSFYMVLCGGKEGRTIKGDNGCIYTSNLTDAELQGRGRELYVEYLDRQKYPNGAVSDFWQSPGTIPSTHPEMVILHNNWIRGLDGKTLRLTNNSLWWYNSEEELCNYHDTPTPLPEAAKPKPPTTSTTTQPKAKFGPAKQAKKKPAVAAAHDTGKKQAKLAGKPNMA